MITIATFSKPEEAHLLRMRLEAVGIPAYIRDENTIQMDWLYSNLIGGVRVEISPEDEAEAREFLEADTVQEPDDSIDEICPQCGSKEVEPDETPRRLSFLSVLLLGFPFLIAKNRWHCLSCQHQFKD